MNSPRPSARRSVLLAAMLLPSFAGGQAARADVPLPPPPPGMRPLAAPPTQSAAPPSAPPPVRAARFHVAFGFDFGLEEYARLEYDDGSEDTLDLNDGMGLSVGASFLPLLGGKLDTVASAGVKYWSVGADNGSLSYLAFPIELLERVRVHPRARLGAGVALQLAPRVKGDGVVADLGADAKHSLGLVFQGEGVFQAGRAEFSAGLRYVWQKLEAERGGPAVDASAVGFFVSWQP